jgi:DNA modification methylase
VSTTILCGDCRQLLATLPADSVHCVVTSPPYWGLRDYGVAGQIGLEANYHDFIAEMVGVFREVRRVLRPDGTLWLNLGDSYATGVGKVGGCPGGGEQGARWAGTSSKRPAMGKHAYVGDRIGVGPGSQPNRMPQPGLKPKDLCGIPWRIAFALQDAGWWLRQDIIYSKPNPMPESVTDRCTKSHEYLFLLTKSQRYYFDQEAILEECSPSTHARLSQDVQAQIGSERVPGKTNGTMKAVARRGGGDRRHKGTEAYEAGASEHRTKAGLVQFADRQRKLAEAGSGIKNNDSFDAAMAIMPIRRNRRSVWEVATQPFFEAHFATFPPALIEPCILAGSPKGGLILDPFFGAGTTGLVADRFGRNCIGIELNPEYVALAERRIKQDAGMFAEVLGITHG